MNEREQMLLRIAVSYMLSNLDDVCTAFGRDDLEPGQEAMIEYNGEVVPAPEEDELDGLMTILQ